MSVTIASPMNFMLQSALPSLRVTSAASIGQHLATPLTLRSGREGIRLRDFLRDSPGFQLVPELSPSLVRERLQEEIVAHIALRFYSGASGTFSTASTFAISRACFVPRLHGWG
jgi:hypothetical protein